MSNKMIGMYFEDDVKSLLEKDREGMFKSMKKTGYRGKTLSWASFFYAIWQEWRKTNG